MTLQGVIITVSFSLPPVAVFIFFRRIGKSLAQAAIAAVYVFAVCLLVLFGLVYLEIRYSMFGDSLGYVYPFLLAMCLFLLVAAQWDRPQDKDGRQSDR
jgi:hypothetical protein